jgi:hypothetical protein
MSQKTDEDIYKEARSRQCQGHTHAAIPALGVGLAPDFSGIADLEVLIPRGLDRHLVLGLKSGSVGTIVVSSLGGAAVAGAVGNRHGCGAGGLEWRRL